MAKIALLSLLKTADKASGLNVEKGESCLIVCSITL